MNVIPGNQDVKLKNDPQGTEATQSEDERSVIYFCKCDYLTGNKQLPKL